MLKWRERRTQLLSSAGHIYPTAVTNLHCTYSSFVLLLCPTVTAVSPTFYQRLQSQQSHQPPPPPASGFQRGSKHQRRSDKLNYPLSPAIIKIIVDSLSWLYRLPPRFKQGLPTTVNCKKVILTFSHCNQWVLPWWTAILLVSSVCSVCVCGGGQRISQHTVYWREKKEQHGCRSEWLRDMPEERAQRK